MNFYSGHWRYSTPGEWVVNLYKYKLQVQISHNKVAIAVKFLDYFGKTITAKILIKGQ